MDLLLKVIDGPSDGNWRGLEARFDASGGLIGRAETARLVLPDTSRTVSRFHTHVSFSDGTFYLEEMGSRNAATINGKALKAGNKQPLRPGDQVRIGHFTLSVEFDDPDFPTTQVLDRRSVPALAQDGDGSVRAVEGGAGQPRSSASNAELLSAFQDGAGIQLEMPHGLGPEFMRTVGLMLRTLVGGVHRLSAQRVRLRDETSPDKARPQSRHVDPIRAAAEESRRLTALFKPGAIGSTTPQTKIQEMIEDLTARFAAMRTAVNAAVEQAEAKLAPSAVEERLETSLFLDELLPMRRKARLWDLYRRTHGVVTAGHSDAKGGGKGDGNVDDKPDTRSGGKSNAASGVREAFNHAFTRAYEAEVSRLRRDRH
jgi:predicted component of type VI protein secretion system